MYIGGKDSSNNRVSIEASQATPVVDVWGMSIFDPAGQPVSMVRLLNGTVSLESDGQATIAGLGGKFMIGPKQPATIDHTPPIK